MKLNQDIVKRLQGLDDKALWQEIRKMAQEYGLKLPDTTPAASDLAKVRNALGVGEISTAEAIRLVNEYKRRQC
jgi:hypothetical protein